MSPLLIILYALFGLLLNLSFAGQVTQPDWSLALLLATLVSDRKTWFWVLPCLFFHDVVLFWTPWVSLPYAILASIILAYADIRLAPGQQQRWLSLAFVFSAMASTGASAWSWLLTVCVCIAMWSLMSSKREKVYVEPA